MTDEQPQVQVLRSEAGILHLAVNDQRACELRPGADPADRTPTAAELDGVPVDTPTRELCAPCFELPA